MVWAGALVSSLGLAFSARSTAQYLPAGDSQAHRDARGVVGARLLAAAHLEGAGGARGHHDFERKDHLQRRRLLRRLLLLGHAAAVGARLRPSRICRLCSGGSLALRQLAAKGRLEGRAPGEGAWRA